MTPLRGTDAPRIAECVRPGLALGTANRVARMRYTKGWGWIATDWTGAEYVQRVPRWATREQVLWRVLCADGIGGRPWPAKPSERSEEASPKETR